MKKVILVALIALALIIPASAQLRFDVGLYKPLGIGFTELPEVNSELDEVNTFIREQLWFMIPEVAAYYELDMNPLPLKLGFGVRAYSAILATGGWPNILAELELGPILIDAQIGGLFFGYYVLNTIGGDFGNVLIPDLSVWYGFGEKKSLRIGGGATMLYIPDMVAELNEGSGRTIIPFVYYASAKFTIRP